MPLATKPETVVMNAGSGLSHTLRCLELIQVFAYINEQPTSEFTPSIKAKSQIYHYSKQGYVLSQKQNKNRTQ
ncbi:hypothetical protein AG1IA_09146 [Rhizoctonia solani AG-1 IA]|uniref:Uncharacterized protein n=1 Tax=Thanatephorus cucumeris (strain AG1-IA) TaxID=983506 RepID=L8WF80_THACA|nr:hypothetical protein AG1IA_09146 [Rhizoctonia solani AG-1 IA]